ncbi:MAG: sodium:solute symporter family transporter [Planctomycetota bacterium]
MDRSMTILLCLGLYMLICFGVGLWAMRRTKSTKDFFMAGRNLGVLVTALAVFSANMSGFGFVGGPGLVYKMGMSSIWICLTAPLGFAVAFFLLAKRIRLIAELRDSVSLPDTVAARYKSETSRFLTALAIILGVMGYLATQILAMSMVLREILNSNPLFGGGVSLAMCVIISSTVMVFYSVAGGIIASVYADLIQGAIMVVASILVFITATTAVDGGFAGMATTIMKDNPEAIAPWGTLGMIGCLSWYFIFTMGVAGQPHVIIKMMMYKKVSDAKRILPISVGAYAIAALLWLSIGLVMRSLVLQGVHAPLANADEAAPQFLQSCAHPLLAGIVFAGLFSAIMSTGSSFLNIGTAAVIHDMPKAFGIKKIKNELFKARVTTVVLTAVAAFFALYIGDLVALLGAFGWGTFAAALVPTIAVGLNWKRATPLAANVAIIASIVINFGIKMASKSAGFSVPFSVNTGAIALLVSLTLFFGISLLSKPPKLDADIEAVMDI